MTIVVLRVDGAPAGWESTESQDRIANVMKDRQAKEDRTAFRAALAHVLGAVFQRVTKNGFQSTFKRVVSVKSSHVFNDDYGLLAEIVLDCLMFTPDPKGRTAIDRLAYRPPADFGENEEFALSRLREAEFAVVRVDGISDAGFIPCHNILSGQACVLPGIAALPGEVLATRLVVGPDGERMPGSIVLKLPNHGDVLADVRKTADGRAFRNPARAAETLYRQAIKAAAADGESLANWLLLRPTAFPAGGTGSANAPLELSSQAPEIVHDLAALSEDWMALETTDPASADPEGTAWLRGQSTPDIVCTVLYLMDLLPRDHPQYRALDAMALIALDTVTYRAALGLEQSMTDFLAQAEQDGMPVAKEVQARLQELQNRLNAGSGGGASPDLERVIARIRALQAKTQDAGCTEAEAMAAARKAEELLRKYDFALTPDDITKQTCTLVRFPSGRKRFEGLDTCVKPIADFCECWAWAEREEDNTITHTIFGMPADVEAAKALYHVVSDTFATETAAFKAGETYAATPSNNRATATRSFRMGLANGIQRKLETLKTERVRHTQQSSGTDLVPVKTRTMQTALERLGVQFTHEGGRHRRLIDPTSFRQGQASGEEFQPEPELRPKSGDARSGGHP